MAGYDIDGLVKDPDFQRRPFNERKAILREADAEGFGTLPEAAQSRMLVDMKGQEWWQGGKNKIVTGNMNPTPAESERFRREAVTKEGTMETRGRDMLNTAFNPNVRIPAADGLADFAGRVLPQSLTQLGPKMLQGAYEGIKGQTDPLVKSLSSLQPTGIPLHKEMEQNAGRTLRGLADATVTPLGYYGADAAKDAWLTDPAGSLAAVAPVGIGVVRGGKAIKAAGGRMVGTPESLARSALKPYIGESVARQHQAAKGLKTAVSDKNATASMPKFLERNLAEMEEISGRQDVLITEKGEYRAPITEIRAALEDTINQARETPGTADAAVAAAEKVLNDIMNHPDYDLATDSIPIAKLQTMKRNIWGKLREGGTFNKDAVPGLQDAMWDSATGMNEIISKHVPEMAPENARYGELANVNKLLKRAVDRNANNNIIPLRAVIQLVKGDVQGFTQAASLWAFDHPTFKMYLAQRIAKSRGGKRPSTMQVNAVVEAIKTELVQREQTVLDAENLPKISNGNLGDVITGGYQREYGWDGKPTGPQIIENPESLPPRQSSQQPIIGDEQGRIVTQQEAMAPRQEGVKRDALPSAPAREQISGNLVGQSDPVPERLSLRNINSLGLDAPARNQLSVNLVGKSSPPTAKKTPAPAAPTMTWKQFLSENMAAAMKSEGGHGPAMTKLAKDWKNYKK
jgi:hypothetical protein